MENAAQEVIYNKIVKQFTNPKSRKFIEHLLRAFFPVYKATYELERTNGAPLVCCLSGQVLVTKGDQIHNALAMNGLVMDNMFASLKAKVDGVEHVMAPELVAKLEAIRALPLALVSESTNKVISEDALKALMAFYQTRILMGDTHVNWIAKNEQAKAAIRSFEDDGVVVTQKERKVAHKLVESGRSGMSLGDIGVLQDLKKKLENK